jgi:hypothetical protein
MRPSVSLFALLLLFPMGFGLFGQEVAPPPKILIEAKTPTAPNAGDRALNFGSTCRATSGAKSPFYSSYKPASIAEMLGAPVTEIRITRYGTEWKSHDEIRATITLAWNARSDGASPYAPWDEGAWTDIVGTIQFKDGRKSAFEESAGHVCFLVHGGAAIWTRVPVK